MLGTGLTSDLEAATHTRRGLVVVSGLGPPPNGVLNGTRKEVASHRDEPTPNRHVPDAPTPIEPSGIFEPQGRKTMRNRMIRRVVSLTAAIVALGLIAAGPASAIGETPSTIVGVGSDAMYRHGQQIDQLYNSTPGCNIIAPAGTTQLFDYECLADTASTVTTENYTHDEAYSSYPLGGGSGIKQICQQGLANVRDADFARQTKAPSATDCAGTNFVAYGRDALTWEAFPGLAGSPAKKLDNSAGSCNGGFCLTIDQLHKIFLTCEIDTWDDLGLGFDRRYRDLHRDPGRRHPYGVGRVPGRRLFDLHPGR